MARLKGEYDRYPVERAYRSLGQLAELHQQTSMFKGLPEEEFTPLIEALLDGQSLPEVGDVRKFKTITAVFLGHGGWKEKK